MDEAVEEVVIEIPRMAPGLNGPKGLMRMHFGEYRKEKEKWMWWLKKEAGGKKAPVPCTIEINRYYAKQPMDVDNAYSTCKIPLDAMRENGILADDNPNHVSALAVHQHKVAKLKDEKTVIIIRSIPQDTTA